MVVAVEGGARGRLPQGRVGRFSVRKPSGKRVKFAFFEINVEKVVGPREGGAHSSPHGGCEGRE